MIDVLHKNRNFLPIVYVNYNRNLAVPVIAQSVVALCEVTRALHKWAFDSRRLHQTSGK